MINKNKIASDEVIINNVIVPKRLMFNQQKAIQNGVKLSYDHSFGFYQYPIRKNAHFINDDDLIYPNGKHLIKYDMMKKKQTFILKNMEDEKITAMKYHHSRGANRTLIAVALKSGKKSIALVRVYYLSKNFSYNLVHSHLPTQVDVIDITFLHKGKYLLSLAEVEKTEIYKLTLWNIEHEKYVWETQVDAHLTEIDNCIASSKIFSCGGPDYFQIWVYEVTEKNVFKVERDTEFVLSTLNLDGSEEEFTTHCWAKEDNMLIICTNFHIYVFKNMEFREKVAFIYPDADLQTLILEQVFQDDGIYYEKSIALRYLIDINMPAGGIYKDGDLPEMLFEMFNNEYSYGDLQKNDDKFVEGKRDYNDKLSPRKIRQLLIDRDDDILEKFTPIYIRLMRDILHHLKVRINCICPQENGFAVGIKGSGIVCLFKEKNEKYIMESSSKIQNREVDYIHSLSSSSDNSHIAVVAKIKKKFATTVDDDSSSVTTTGTLEAFIFNSSLVNAIKVSYKEPFEFLDPYGPHSGGIMSLSLCPSKSIIGTLSTDKTLKLWNYTASEKQLFSYEFLIMSQQAFDIHPMSIQCAVGFKGGIEIYFLLENSLESAHKNFTKSCKAIKYSEGGHFLAVGIMNHIQIICPYRLKKYRTLTGHSGNVWKFRWKDRDKYLLSLCSNSIVLVWDVNNDWDQYVEHYIGDKNHKYLDVDYDPEFDILLCCCSDYSVKFFRNKGSEFMFNYEDRPDRETNPDPNMLLYTSLLISKRFKVCFIGCNDGSLKIFLWPFIKIGGSKFEYMHIAVHQEKITDIRIGYNEEHLITASEDGSVFFLGIKEIAKGKDITVGDILTTINEKDEGNQNLAKISNTFNMNEFAMLSSKMEKTMQEKITTLDRDIQNTISAIEENNENITESYNRRIRKIEEDNQAILKKRNIELASQMDERGSKQKRLDIMIKNLENKLKETVKSKEEYHRKTLLKLYADRDEIKRKKDQFERQKNNEIEKMTEKFIGLLEGNKYSYENQKRDISQKSKKAMFNLKSDQMMFQEALRQAEEDYNEDLHQTVKKLEEEYEKVKTEGELLRSKNSKYEKDIERNKERSSNLTSLIRETENQNRQLQMEIDHFKKKGDEMKTQLEEQETIINMKENMIKEFRNMNYHLQNYKSVYDYQVSTLKEEHEPLNEYVDNLEKHIKTMYNELLSEADSYKNLEKNVRGLESVLGQEMDQVKKKQNFLMKTQRRFQNFENKMALLLQNYSNNPVFKLELTKMLESEIKEIQRTEHRLTQAQNNSVNEVMETKKMHSLEKLSAMELQSIKEDLLRQRDLMSKRLYRRTQRNKVLEKERENVYKSIQEEGKMLVNKCNMLRKEGLLLMYKIGLTKKEAEELTSEMNVNFNEKGKFFKKSQPRKAYGKMKKRNKLLPIEEYRKNNRPRKKEETEEGSKVSREYPHSDNFKFEVDKFYQRVKEFIKDNDDKRSNASNSNSNNFQILQEKGHNFKMGDKYL